MTLIRSCSTKLFLCVVVFFVASGFANATNIPVMNPSFETPPAGGFSDVCGPGCQFSVNAPIPGWTSSGPGPFGQFQPGPQAGNFDFFNSVPDGITTAYSDGGTISQVVGPVEEGQIYTLKVYLGANRQVPFDASADLLVSGVTYMATGTTPGLGNWSTYTATFMGTSANAGEMITIQLVSLGRQGNFDNVRLTASPTVPEPSSMLLLGSSVLGLAQVLRRKRL